MVFTNLFTQIDWKTVILHIILIDPKIKMVILLTNHSIYSLLDQSKKKTMNKVKRTHIQ